jgi:hypothetical protein
MYSAHGNVMSDVFGQTSMLGLYRTNAWDLEPDASANDGDIFIAIRRTNPGMAATELAWRIIRDFFGNQPYVAGTSVDDTGPGLKVRKHGTGMMIDVSPDYATKTTPRTLRNRVAEMRQALDLVAKKAEGVIPVK